MGFERGTGNWPQETWVYNGIVWVAFSPVSGEWNRFADTMNEDIPAAFVASEIDAEALLAAVKAVVEYEKHLSATYQGDD
jgi:hypothetical protein